MKHAVIVANGPFLAKEIIEEAVKNKHIVALDGAANRLAQIGILPNVVLGDFDSMPESGRNVWGLHKHFHDMSTTDSPYLGNYGVTIVPAKDQKHTDLTKAIHFCDTQGFDAITVICATGGRLDHHQATMTALRREYKKDRPILLHTEQQTVCFMKDGKLVVKGRPGDKVGISAYPSATVTTSGLLYELKDHALEIGMTESTCNELTGKTAQVHVQGEAIVYLSPALKSQRDYAEKNEFERAEIAIRDAARHLIEISDDDLATYIHYRRQFAAKGSELLSDETLFVSQQNDLSIHGNPGSKTLLSVTPEKMQKLLLFQAHINEYNVNPAAGMDFDVEVDIDEVSGGY